MVKFTSLDKLRILDFFQVATDISAHLAKYSLGTLRLTAPAGEFRSALATLDEALKPMRASAKTRKIIELDAHRDNALIGLSEFINSFLRSRRPEKAEAAHRLRILMDKYGKSPQLLPLREETAAINSLLQDFAQAENAAAAAELGAASWTEDLQQTNSEFEALYNSRSEENALVEAGKTKEARRLTQEKLSRLIKIINAHEILEDHADYQALSNEIDYEIRQAKSLYRDKTKDEAGAGEA